MTNDTLETEPVEGDEAQLSLEDEIASQLDAGEQTDAEMEAKESGDEADSNEALEQSDETEGPNSDTDLDAGSEDDSGSDDIQAEGSDSESEDGDAEDIENGLGSEDIDSEPLAPPEHWSALDKEQFNEQPRGAQEWMLKRHKEMEGDYTRKRQQESSQVRMADAVSDALAPYKQEFASAGLDEAGAVRQLASWHHALRTSPREAIEQLANTYGVDLSNPVEDTTDPALKHIQSQLNQIQTDSARRDHEAQQNQNLAIFNEIQQFESATGEDGKLLHPHFRALEEDITMLFNAKKASNLDDAYNKALLMHPELTPVVKPKPKPKVDPVEKVKAAKRAAAGVKSAGVVGKKERAAMSLEQEIASQIP